MDSTTRQLTILLKLAADVADKVKVTSGLQEIETQAVKTAAAIQRVSTGRAGQTITDNSIPAAATAEQVAAEKLSAIRTAELRARMAARDVAVETAVVEQKSVATEVEKLAVMERRLVMEIQLEAAEARIAGNPALALRLEREADIRLRALTIQRATNVSMEVAIAQAERLVIAHEAGIAPTLLVGANLNKAKAEAIQLVKELAVGGVNTRTIGAFATSLGTTLGIAGLAGFELYHFISGQVQQTRELTKEYERIVAELNKVSTEWDTIASRAEVFGDKVKIADKIKQELDKMSKEMDEFRKKQLPLWQRFWDDWVTGADNAFDTHGVLATPGAPRSQGPFSSDRDKKILEESNRELDRANAALDKTQHKTEEWAAAQADVGRGLADYSVKLSEAEAKLEQLDAARHAGGTPEERRAALDAFKEQLDVVNDLRGKVNQLGDAWEKTTKSEATAARRAQQQQINASLREQQNLLDSIRQHQQIIAQHPLLSADQKQAMLLTSMTAEMAALGGAIARTKEQLKDSALDPVTHERLQAEVQRLGFEFDSLGQKIAAIKAPFATELIAWVNQLGTAAHQVAGVMTSTLQTAIDGISQSITGLIVGTQNWEQAWNQAVISILGGIVKMVVQWIAGQVVMFAVRQIFGKQEASTSASLAETSAAEWAPAAVSASIASYGAASGFGVAAYIAALAAGTAAAAGASAIGGVGGGTGFARGGRTGSGPRIATVGEEGEEFVFTHKATRNIGIDRLYSMMHAAENAPHFYEGGEVEPGILPGTGGPPRNIHLGGLNYPGSYHWPPYPYVGDYGVSPHLFPGGGATPPPYGFNPGAHVYINPATGQVVTGSSGSVSAYYDPYHVNPGGSVGAFYVPATGTYVTPGGYVAAGYHPPSSIIIPGRDLGGIGMGNVTAYYDPSTNTYVTPGGQVAASYDPSSGTYVTPGGQVVAGAHGGHGNSGGYPAPGYNGPGSNFAGTPIPGYTIIGHDTVNGAPIYRNVATGRLFVLPGTGRPIGPMTPQAYARATFGGVSPTGYRDTRGSAIFDSHAAGLMEMGRQADGGSTGTRLPDERVLAASFDLTTGESIVRPFRGGFVGDAQHPWTGDPHDPWGNFAAQNWALFNANLRAWNAPHGAEGMRLPGAPSKTDSILAWLAPGEHVVDAYTTALADRTYGRDWPSQLGRLPHLASGGRAGGDSSFSSSRSNQRPIVNVALFDDPRKALKWLDSQEGEKIFEDLFTRKRHTFGLGAVN